MQAWLVLPPSGDEGTYDTKAQIFEPAWLLNKVEASLACGYNEWVNNKRAQYLRYSAEYNDSRKRWEPVPNVCQRNQSVLSRDRDVFLNLNGIAEI